MGEISKIGWTKSTWNPVLGCSKVSEGCHNCYAETLALRYGWSKKPWAARFADENVVLKPGKLTLPLTPKWDEPRMVFVNSLSDVFHPNIPDDYVDMMWGVMALASQHTYQILTKRPDRMRDYMKGLTTGRIKRGAVAALKPTKIDTGINNIMELLPKKHQDTLTALTDPVLPNVWMGTSVELQKWVDPRVSALVDTPARIRFLSCEPLLGPLDLMDWLEPTTDSCTCGVPENMAHLGHESFCGRLESKISWVIVGGESGAKRRPFKMEWARDIKEQCEATGTAFFMKQIGAFKSGQHEYVSEADGSCWEWRQFPTGYPLAEPVLDHTMSTCEVGLAAYQAANPQGAFAL
jgi:protein gp37